MLTGPLVSSVLGSTKVHPAGVQKGSAGSLGYLHAADQGLGQTLARADGLK